MCFFYSALVMNPTGQSKMENWCSIVIIYFNIYFDIFFFNTLKTK